MPFTKTWELCNIPGYKTAAKIIYGAFHADRRKSGKHSTKGLRDEVKHYPLNYVATYLMYATNLETNPMPPKELLLDNWNKYALLETTFDNRSTRILLYAYEYYMLRVGKLPPKEYFDKTYIYSLHDNGNDKAVWSYWKTHRDDVDKIKEYICEKSFTDLVYFLVIKENKEMCNELYFTKKYINIIKLNVVDIYYDLNCKCIPEALKVDGW